MTAAASRWFLGLSGADLLVGWVVLCILSAIAVYAAVEAILSICKHLQASQHMARPHHAQGRPGALRGSVPMRPGTGAAVVALAFVALVLAIAFRCGVLP